jgi:MRG-binding protein
MVALSEHLRNHGYDTRNHPHTRIPGIWEKLGTLYNLEVIDERENSFDYGEEDAVEEKYLEFSLPDEDYGEMMWIQGMVKETTSEADSSPPQLNEPSKKRKRGDLSGRTRASTVDDTDEPRTSPAPSPAVKAGRGVKKGRKSTSRARQASKDTTVDETDEQVEDEDVEDEEEEEEEEEEDGDDGTPSPKAPRGRTKPGRGGSQARPQSTTRKSRRRK